MIISKKDELYTYDELDFIKNSVCDAKTDDFENLISKIEILQNSILSDKEKMAIFFMPESTFAIFSIFQGNKPLCEIGTEDVQNMVLSVGKVPDSEVKNHIEKKLKVLNDFLAEGNKVKPVSTAADYLSEI